MRYVAMIVINYELLGIWEEVIMVYFNVLDPGK